MNRQTGRLIFGFLWILDGILELLPDTAKNFISIIQSMADGQPAWLQSMLTWTANLLSPHAILWNGVLGVAEIVVGVLLLFAVSARLGIILSIALAIPIWIVGQAFGGILTGSATDPGAMPLYILAALLVWPRREVVDSAGSSSEYSPVTSVTPRTREGAGSVHQ
jgi:hypothetical protein